jgi:integrase
MDLTELQQDCPRLIGYLKDAGYSPDYVRRFEKMLRFILENDDKGQWGTYADIYESFAETTSSQSVLHQAYAILGGIRHFHLHGRLPDGGRRHQLVDRNPLDGLSSDFAELVKHYSSQAREHGKKEQTIGSETSCSLTFLKAMQACGHHSLEEVTEEDALGFFLENGTLSKSASYVKNLRAVFNAGLSWREVPCRRILLWLPKIRRSRKNIQYLTEEEAAGIKAVIADLASGLSLRDRAIGLMLIHYGLRSSDIAGLALGSIGWAASEMSISQSKTGFPLTLPLIPVVGNAIYDYLVDERGASSLPHVFLSERAPVRQAISSSAVYGVTGKLFDLAGLRQNPGDRRGTHIFRHRFATALLSKGAALPVISQAMGHLSPASVEAYLSADFAHLRECALSIEGLPSVPKEVFCHGVRL